MLTIVIIIILLQSAAIIYNTYMYMQLELVFGTFRAIRRCFKKCRSSNASVDQQPPNGDVHSFTARFLQNERLKPAVTDFTLEEYKEKVIQYGFLVVSATLKESFIVFSQFQKSKTSITLYI